MIGPDSASGAAPRSEAELRRLGGVKWTRYPADVLPAWVADMDLAPPSMAVDAVIGLAQRGDFGYNFRAAELLPEAFCAWQRRYHGWEPPVDEVVLFNDVIHAIEISIWLHTEPGDGVVLLTPIYPPFLWSLESAGRRLVDVPLDPDGWRLDPDRLAAAIDDRTSAILLCNPHNPTGRVFDQEEREAIGRVVVEHDLLLISDEVWGDLTHPGSTHRPMATVDPEVRARTVTISSASKPFNLAGLRCAAAHVGSTSVAAALAELPGHFLGAVGSPGAEAALACWTQGHEWLDGTRRFLTERRDQLTKRVQDDLAGVRLQPPQATYLAWLDLSELDLGPEPADWLLEQARVAVWPGSDFGPNGDGFVRLNFATSPDLLDRLIDRTADALSSPADPS